MKLIKKKGSLQPEVEDFINKIGLKDINHTNDPKAQVKQKGQIKGKLKHPKGKNNFLKGKHFENDKRKNAKKDGKAAIKQNTQLLIKPGTIWFEKTANTDCPAGERCSKEEITKFRQEGESLFQNDVTSYKQFLKSRKEKADFGWAQTVLKSGTLSDKMAAHIMLIQDSPIHTLNSVEVLCSMVNTKGKRECILAMDTLKDLFLGNLLVKDRKLKLFEAHPFSKLAEISSGNKEVRNRILLLWYFEDQLKHIYSKFLQALEFVICDTNEKLKLKTIGVMAELLIENSEQEEFILSKLVNKVGDPVNRVSGGVIHYLNKIVDSHPNMKRTVIDEVERLIFRLNIKPRTQYYCLCFMNQLILDVEDSDLASHLIKVYFAFFKVCVKKGEVDSKMMSALLSGTSRAFPFAKTNKDELIQQIDMLFKVVHMVNLNISIQTLMLIFQALDSSEGPSDRFYTALYKIILDPELATTCRQTMFLNLMFRAIKKDSNDRRVKAFIRRLLQVCYYLPPPMICGILFLVSEVYKVRTTAIYFDPKPSLSSCNLDDGKDEDEEHYDDVLDDEDISGSVKQTETDPTNTTESTWFHVKQNTNKHASRCSTYDPMYWNPLHCFADSTAFWEASHLGQHFHPSVANFINSVLKKESIDYSGDPLSDFTLSRFLERFVYRNPKKHTENASQDLHTRVFGRRRLYVSAGSRSVPVNSYNYMFQEEDKVPKEELFLYHYLKEAESNKGKKKKKKKGIDEESVTSEDFERLLEKLEPGSWDKVDFAKGMQKKSDNKRKVKEMKDDDDDEEEDYAEDQDFKNAFDEYDDDLKNIEDPGVEMEDDFEEENFDDDDDDENMWGVKRKKKNKSKTFDPSTLFASAEEFGDMLEENANDGNQAITSQAFQNKDKAGAKQLAWETKRDQFVRGAHWMDKKRKGNNRNMRTATKGKKFKKRR